MLPEESPLNTTRTSSKHKRQSTQKPFASQHAEVPAAEPTGHVEVGLANPQLGQGRRSTLDLVNKLHNTGVQVDIDLPQIAVIGSQSAGKSSLIESISGINLPRAAGTCTRCPTECRLSRSNTAWQCIVSLHFITDAAGQPLGQARNVTFGPTIYDKSLVEDRIRRAQLAILNPNLSPDTFLSEKGDNTKEHEGQLSFSHNSVTLQISGPEVADLSFCDLPGLIASVSSNRGSGDDIGLVESLVTSYIKKPSCIILLTVACETDFENQGAHRLAKQYDPHGKRTIGVLTKPDRIPIGEEANWLPFIRNEKETLENNWFCVKQPSSNDLKKNPTWEYARRKENNFFSSKAPWCNLESIYQKYLRTSNLVGRLSAVLSGLISKRLPQIQDELEKSILNTRNLLSKLPREPSSDPRGEITALLHRFASDLDLHIRGVSDASEAGLIQAIRPAQERFRSAIRSTAPKFRPFERRDAGKKHLRAAAFLRTEEGDVPEGEASEDEPEVVWVDEVEGTASRKRKKRDSSAIYIDEVLEHAHRARARELPGNVPFVVQKTLIDKVIKEWQAPAHILCKTVHSTVLEYFKVLVEKHFKEFGQGHLEHRVKSIMQQHMKARLESAEKSVAWLLSLEDLPFSLNTHYLADYRSKFLAYYKGSREEYNRTDLINAIREYEKPSSSRQKKGGIWTPPDSSPEPTAISKILGGLAEIGVNIKPEDLAKLLPPDRMEPALVIMSDVRAYFQVAYKRFADIVPLAIDRELVRGAAADVLQVLNSNLGINGVEGTRLCKEMAQENPQVSDRRADLLKKLERLESASEELLSIGA